MHRSAFRQVGPEPAGERLEYVGELVGALADPTASRWDGPVRTHSAAWRWPPPCTVLPLTANAPSALRTRVRSVHVPCEKVRVLAVDVPADDAPRVDADDVVAEEARRQRRLLDGQRLGPPTDLDAPAP